MLRVKIGYAVLLLALTGSYRASAILNCGGCTCNWACSTPCSGSGFPTTTCAATGLCTGSASCSGGCLAFTGREPSKELFAGLAGVLPAGAEQGRAAARLTWRLTQHVEERGLGEVYTAGTGFLLATEAGKLRAPELAFVSRERQASGTSPAGFRVGAPDLVAEVLPASSLATVGKNDALHWIAAGARAVLVLDSGRKTVTVYRGHGAPQVLGQGDTLEASDIVPGWELRLDDLFD